MEISKLFHQTTASLEDKIDIARRAFWRKSGRNLPVQIIAHHGYANPDEINISGRVLANRVDTDALQEDGWWENLVNTYKRWETDEVPNAPVRIRFDGRELETTTDLEGPRDKGWPECGWTDWMWPRSLVRFRR